MAPTTNRRLLLSSLHCPLCCQLDARSKHPEIFSLCEPEHLQGPCMHPTASDSCRMETRSTSMPIHVWQRCLCSLPHAELFEAGRFLTSSGPGRTWVLAPIASRPVRISFLVFGTHLLSDFFCLVGNLRCDWPDLATAPSSCFGGALHQVQERSWHCLARRCRTLRHDHEGLVRRVMRCPPWKMELFAQWTQQQLCGLLRLHPYAPVEAHGKHTTSHPLKTETVPTNLVLGKFCEPGHADEVRFQSMARLQVVLAKHGAS